MTTQQAAFLRRFAISGRRRCAELRRRAIAPGIFFAGLAASLGLAAPVPAMAAEPEEIAIFGSSTIGEALMPALISGFAQQRGLALVRNPDPNDPQRETLQGVFGLDPVLAITMERRGTATAFAALADGSADIGMASRPISPTEEVLLRKAGAAAMRDQESEHVLALDGIAVIVAPDNPLGAISLADLAAVFAGEISDWSALGLPPGPIRIHARDDRSGTHDSFGAIVLEPAVKPLAPEAVRHGSNEELVAGVIADPAAIGYTAFGAAGRAKIVSLSLSCGIIVRPGEFSVQAEEYPLARRLYLYTRGAPESAETRALLDHAVSDAAQPIIKGVGFIDQRVKTAQAESAGERLINGMRAARSDAEKGEMRRFIETAKAASRLSPTFRFQPGRDLLDGKAIADAERLARWLERPENASRSVLLAGFSDGSGSFESNKALTLKRAEAVRRAVLVQVSPGFDPSRIRVDGFGSAAPIACDDDPGGDAANRRVEVWVRN